MLIVKDPSVTVICRTAIKALFVYFNLCLCVMLDNLSCSFKSISFLTNFTVVNYKTEEDKQRRALLEMVGVRMILLMNFFGGPKILAMK
jgi:hypothetical protein